MARSPRSTPAAIDTLEPANDTGPKARKPKRETKDQRDLREWHERCQALIKARAPWLRDDEFEMLDSQTRYDKPPTENREKYAGHIAYETELVSGIDGVSVAQLVAAVAGIKPLLRAFEEEERVTELEQLRPTKLPRREAEWLFGLAKRFAI